MENVLNCSKLNVFMIGIGGISMSGLALMLQNLGHTVSGSDANDSSETAKLSSLGVQVFIGHNKNNLTADIDLVVYSGAISECNEERCRARELNIPQMERSEFLGLICTRYKRVIAIAGTHGKTTTTAMLANIFICAGLNPTIHLGGVSNNLKSNTIIGGNKYLIVEACEYRNSFGYIRSDTAVITNIDNDHLDYYKNIEGLRSAFGGFANKSNYLITGENVNVGCDEVVGDDWKAVNIHVIDGGYNYDVFYKGELFESIRLNLIGRHNITNSLYAIAVANHYGICKEDIIKGIESFKGVERRYEEVGRMEGIPIIIDYAHHPSEIKTSIEGMKEVYSNLLCIFQPHTYSRTYNLMGEFVEVLSSVESLVIYPTYSAREVEIVGGRGIDLHNNLVNSDYIERVNEVVEKISIECERGDIQGVLILGAGDLAIKIKEYMQKST